MVALATAKGTIQSIQKPYFCSFAVGRVGERSRSSGGGSSNDFRGGIDGSGPGFIVVNDGRGDAYVVVDVVDDDVSGFVDGGGVGGWCMLVMAMVY